VHHLTLYTRSGCHLCEDMKAVVLQVAHQVPLHLEEVDITGQPDLEARYGLEVPVLLIDGRKVAKFRISDSQLLRRLRGRARSGRQD
jgi:glutaredoxin